MMRHATLCDDTVLGAIRYSRPGGRIQPISVTCSVSPEAAWSQRWQAVALAGGLAALLTSAIVLTQQLPGRQSSVAQTLLDGQGPTTLASRLLVARSAAGRQQLVTVDLRTGQVSFAGQERQ
jgi:hypothetical protein